MSLTLYAAKEANENVQVHNFLMVVKQIYDVRPTIDCDR